MNRVIRSKKAIISCREKLPRLYATINIYWFTKLIINKITNSAGLRNSITTSWSLRITTGSRRVTTTGGRRVTTTTGGRRVTTTTGGRRVTSSARSRRISSSTWGRRITTSRGIALLRGVTSLKISSLFLVALTKIKQHLLCPVHKPCFGCQKCGIS